MNKNWMVLAAVLAVGMVVAASTLSFAKNDESLQTRNDVLFQAGSIQALNEGQFSPLLTVGQGLSEGSVGMGTFIGMNGEMIVLDGVCYQITIDGKVHVVDASAGTPYMVVGDFAPEKRVQSSPAENISVEMLYVLAEIHRDLFNLITITGDFSYIKVRSVPMQQEPYPTLQDVVANQSVYEYRNISGTMVVIYTPDYVGTLDAVGFHCHFISDDRTKGGHVLDLVLESAEIGIDEKEELRLWKPMLAQDA